MHVLDYILDKVSKMFKFNNHPNEREYLIERVRESLEPSADRKWVL